MPLDCQVPGEVEKRGDTGAEGKGWGGVEILNRGCEGEMSEGQIKSRSLTRQAKLSAFDFGSDRNSYKQRHERAGRAVAPRPINITRDVVWPPAPLSVVSDPALCRLPYAIAPSIPPFFPFSLSYSLHLSPSSRGLWHPQAPSSFSKPLSHPIHVYDRGDGTVFYVYCRIYYGTPARPGLSSSVALLIDSAILSPRCCCCWCFWCCHNVRGWLYVPREAGKGQCGQKPSGKGSDGPRLVDGEAEGLRFA
ncbi:hypothetical protein E2C01_008636 [Portunus trituberculatus]|uniref:Uncharacterized protein n=1 Tax=Portunus trituberculatus TaxID=210409 RepID=A0A5B7D1A7_PORTR|nr:hypothetical protein [Portunus trituberculatus]